MPADVLQHKNVRNTEVPDTQRTATSHISVPMPHEHMCERRSSCMKTSYLGGCQHLPYRRTSGGKLQEARSPRAHERGQYHHSDSLRNRADDKMLTSAREAQLLSKTVAASSQKSHRATPSPVSVMPVCWPRRRRPPSNRGHIARRLPAQGSAEIAVNWPTRGPTPVCRAGCLSRGSRGEQCTSREWSENVGEIVQREHEQTGARASKVYVYRTQRPPKPLDPVLHDRFPRQWAPPQEISGFLEPTASCDLAAEKRTGPSCRRL